ncbi:hypothetical protein V1478_013558 [Vespula squamosa]|uniref:Uncharacterized protein n=1 Tax=Vespula squamosa TaxID=30214 RepID=A0ABD2A6C2_VESSQ
MTKAPPLSEVVRIRQMIEEERTTLEIPLLESLERRRTAVSNCPSVAGVTPQCGVAICRLALRPRAPPCPSSAATAAPAPAPSNSSRSRSRSRSSTVSGCSACGATSSALCHHQVSTKLTMTS